MIENLCIVVDGSGYESMGFTKPTNTHTQVTHGLADTGSKIMAIGPDLVKRLGVQPKEMVNLSAKVKGVDSKLMKVLGGIPVKICLNLDNDGRMWETRQLACVVQSLG